MFGDRPRQAGVPTDSPADDRATDDRADDYRATDYRAEGAGTRAGIGRLVNRRNAR
jgi:hypothetical protein